MTVANLEWTQSPAGSSPAHPETSVISSLHTTKVKLAVDKENVKAMLHYFPLFK